MDSKTCDKYIKKNGLLLNLFAFGLWKFTERVMLSFLEFLDHFFLFCHEIFNLLYLCRCLDLG